MDNARTMDDGTLVYPKRGGVPPALREGYVRDSADPWTMRPILPECPLRQKNESKVPCNRSPSGWRIVVQYTCVAGKRADYNGCTECIGFGDQEQLVKIHVNKAPA